MNYKNKYVMFAIIILIISLFTSTCYAKFSDIPLTTYAYSNAEMDSVFIKDISITDNVNADISNSEIINFTKTMMYSKVTLSDTDINSTLTMTLSIYNYGTSVTTFEKVLTDILDTSIYSNSNIDYVLDGLNITDQISPRNGITFTITFKYSLDYINSMPTYPLDNTLTSYINFKFGHDFVTKFNSNLGECESINDYYVEYGQPLLDLDNELPTRTGYIFMGWFDNKDYLNGNMFYNEEQNRLDLKDIPYDKYNITLYAGWEPIKYTVTYNYNNLPPNIYQEVEYIESTGKEYIDTQVEFSRDILVYDYSLAFTELKSSGYDLSGISNGGYWGANNGGWSSGGNAKTKIELNKTYSVLFDSSDASLYVNDTKVDNRTLDITAQGTFLLFGARTTGGNVNDTYFQKVKRGILEIKKNNETIRYMIPCIRISDNTVGMYDTIENKFYTNLGTGKFIAGPIKNETITQYYTINSKKEFLKNSHEKENYTFVGWYDPISDKIYDENEQVSNIINENIINYNLYASWKMNINLKFIDYENNEYIKQLSILENNLINYKADIIQKNNFKFLGWYNQNIKYFDEFGNYVYNESIVKETIELGPKFINTLPEGYKELVYIESTGKEYIDTEVEFSRDLIIYDYSVAFTEFKSSGYSISGVSHGGYWGVQNGKWSSGGPAIVSSTLNTFYYLMYDSHDVSLYVNGIQVDQRTSSTTAQGTLLLFGTRYTNSTVYNDYYQKVKRGILEIKKNNTTIRYLVPCVHTEDNIIGMYDTVNKEFYTNKGTGSFIAGPEITD